MSFSARVSWRRKNPADSSKRLHEGFISPFMEFVRAHRIAVASLYQYDKGEAREEVAHVSLYPFHHKDGEATDALRICVFYRDGRAVLCRTVRSLITPEKTDITWAKCAQGLVEAALAEARADEERVVRFVRPGIEEMRRALRDAESVRGKRK